MSLGDRIKRYENVSRQYLTPRTPVMIRVDGRSFHTFTKGYNRPFDRLIMDSMVSSAIDLANEIQGFKAAYIQSDEATFVFTDYDSLEAQGWFNYNHSKIVSISAAIMSVRFSEYMSLNKAPVFDSRAFNIPSDDVVNAFLWRAQDWSRNSIQMYARSFFSHKNLHKKNSEDIHNMLHKIGKNWTTDLSDIEKNGIFLINTENGLDEKSDIKPNYDEVSKIWN